MIKYRLTISYYLNGQTSIIQHDVEAETLFGAVSQICDQYPDFYDPMLDKVEVFSGEWKPCITSQDSGLHIKDKSFTAATAYGMIEMEIAELISV